MNLLELLVTLGIVSILSIFGINSYVNNLTHANRVTAEISLLKLSLALSDYFVENNTFKNATLENLNITSPKDYQLSISETTDNDFVVTALPTGSQAKRDVTCGTLGLNSSGERSIAGPGKIKECWT